MLDRWGIAAVKKPLNMIAEKLCKIGIQPDYITVIGFLIGVAAVPTLWQGYFYIALGLIIINRIMDGLDGAMARIFGQTDAGGFLDIVLDFIFYSAIIVGFALNCPTQNALPAVIIIFSFMGTGSSFLAFAVMAAKNNLESIRYPQKSMYYLGGLTEGTETILLFVAMCLFPKYFPELAYGFAVLCGITTTTRIISGYWTLRTIIPLNRDLEP